MNLDNAQQALAQLFTSGAFIYSDDLATVPYEQYRDIIESLEPAEQYSIGYDLNGINWLENCFLDLDDNDLVEMIRRERTWQYGQTRAFQLELITVPKLIMVTTEPNPPQILSTTWYLNKHSQVIAYIQTMNGVTLEDIRSE